MYASLLYSVRTEHDLSPSFETKIGVKRGCILSPTLFSLYLSDLNDCVDIPCDPVVIDTIKISSLLYADDIVLLSNTAEGLQNALNKLGNICETWNLKINISKTKVMVFNKSGKLLIGFSLIYMQMAIEIVQEYKYLGIKFKPSGVFSHAVKYLYNKALKATFCVRRALKAESINTESYLTSYEHCIKPILLYCSEIWSIDFLINKSGQTEIA